MSTLKGTITRAESIANQTNYILTGITTMILAAMTAAIQSGVVNEALMEWLWFGWIVSFTARIVERAVAWWTRVRETVTLAQVGASKTSPIVPAPS